MKMICEKCGKEQKPLKSESNKNWNVIEPHGTITYINFEDPLTIGLEFSKNYPPKMYNCFGDETRIADVPEKQFITYIYDLIGYYKVRRIMRQQLKDEKEEKKT